MTYRHVRVVIVGGGINGLCAAWQLADELDGAEIVVVDPAPPGHARGSSHGAERITRTTYETVGWVLAARRARNELWPRLEAELGSTLIVPGPVVFWGPEDGPLPAYAASVRRAGARVEEIDSAEARRRFPRMTFAGADRVLHDHDAGVIAAERAILGLHGWLQAHGVQRLTGRVHRVDEDADGVLVRTENDAIRCEAVIVCAGPWVSDLVPSMPPRVTPVRQDVGFWPLPVVAGTDPAWVHLGKEGLHYGLPTLAGGVMKAAFHRTGGQGGAAADDPEADASPDTAALQSVHSRLEAWFAPGPGALIQGDTCFYTNAPDDAFVIEEAPGSKRILVVSACSGHAFKLAPVTGEAAARWAVRVAGG